MRSMTIEELNSIAGASTESDGIQCAGAIVVMGGITAAAAATAGSVAAGLAALTATKAGAAQVLGGVIGMVGACLAFYDDLAPPTWRTADLYDRFQDLIHTVAVLPMDIVDDVREFIGDHAVGHVEIIYEDEVIAEFDYDFTDTPADHT